MLIPHCSPQHHHKSRTGGLGALVVQEVPLVQLVLEDQLIHPGQEYLAVQDLPELPFVPLLKSSSPHNLPFVLGAQADLLLQGVPGVLEDQVLRPLLEVQEAQWQRDH